MAITFWLREEDRQLLEELYKTDLAEAGPDARMRLLTGMLENEGAFTRARKRFVLGKKGIWLQEGTEGRVPYVRIDNNTAYADGLVLTPYHEDDVRFANRTMTIDKRTKLARVELLGSDTDPFLCRVFWTYADALVLKFNPRDHRLLYYSMDGRPD